MRAAFSATPEVRRYVSTYLPLSNMKSPSMIKDPITHVVNAETEPRSSPKGEHIDHLR
jgi:hypothetical protein